MTQALVDEALLRTLRGQFEGLRRTPDGELLYKLIDRGLKKYGDGEARIEQAFLHFAHGLLTRYVGDPSNDAAVRIKARVIQQRLASYLQPRTSADPASAPAKPIEPEVPIARVVEPEAAPIDATQTLREHLAETLTTSLAGDDGRALSHALDANSGNLAAFEEVKAMFMRGLDDLVRSRHDLQQQLNTAAEYLKAVQAERTQLTRELATAQQHGMVDALTGLPGREVFVRALNAEIGRVKRYGFALAVALIEIDDLAGVQDRHGRNTGDAMLRCYARDIFSRFRAYDLVARYGAETFAVLFPNTQKDGAMRALDKARQAANESVLTAAGRAIPLPSFSSALTLYTPGEQPAALLERAQQALAAAKGAGGARTITALAVG
mgnify:FL=1